MSKKNILFLHGYAQSASIFSGKTGGLRKTLKKLGYESHYVNAPLKLQGDQLHDPTAEELDLYGWWPYGMDDYDVQQGIDTVLEASKNLNGEVEGLVGFSQGAGLSGALAAQYKKLIPSLKWAVFYSGFKLKPAKFEHIYEPKISIPSLHVIGELDTVVEEGRCLKLYDACENDTKTMLKHQGGHYVPNNKDFVNKVVSWIQSHNGEVVEKKNEIDDDDLMAAIDNIGKSKV